METNFYQQVMETNSASESLTVTPLYVCDLDTTVTEDLLYYVFSSVGEVVSVTVCRDHISQVSLGYGYVYYGIPQDARKALQSLNFKPINGKCICIMLSDGDCSIRKSEHANIIVANLEPSIDSKYLYEVFSFFGTILSCKLDTDANGRSRGYGFIQFDQEEAAEAAILRLDNMDFNGRQVHISHFMCKQERDRAEIPHLDRTVYVKYLSDVVQAQYLESVFSPYGTITSTRFLMDDDGYSKCGFIIFENSDAAKSAIEKVNRHIHGDTVSYVGWAKVHEMNEKMIGQKPLYVAMDERKEERRACLQVMETNSASESPTVTPLYVCDLDMTVTEEQLYDVFSSVGEVLSVRVCRDHISQFSLGHGYVYYSNPQDARKALQSLNFKPINGKCVWIMLSDGDHSIRKSEHANVIVADLAHSIDAKVLHELFSVFGTVLSCRLDPSPCRISRRYGFIQFDEEEAAEAAIKRLDNMDIDTTTVRVSHFMCKQERDRAEIPNPDTSVFVKYMSGIVQEQYFESVFAVFGTITSKRVMWDDDGYSKCGLVVFDKSHAAKSAIEKLNGYMHDEMVWYVGWAKLKAKFEPEKSLDDASKAAAVKGKMIGQKPLYVAMDDERKEERRAWLQQEDMTTGMPKKLRCEPSGE